MEHDFSIEDSDIILVPFSREHSEKYRIYRNRDDIRGFFFNSEEISYENQEEWYKRYLNDDTQLMFAVIEKTSDEYIGGIGVYDINTQKGEAEVGRIIIDKNIAGGKGYGTKAHYEGLAAIGPCPIHRKTFL